MKNCPASAESPSPPCVAGWRSSPGAAWWIPFPTTWTPWVQTPSAATFPRSGGSRPPPGWSTARNASSASTRCPGSGSASSPNAWTPWPRSTTWPPSSPAPTPQGQPVRVDHYRQGPYESADHALRRPFPGHRAPGSNAVLGQPAIPPAHPGEPAHQPASHRNAGVDPLGPGHPPGLPAPWATPVNTAVPSSPPRGNCWRETSRPRCGSSAAGAATPSCPGRSTPTCPWTTSWAGWEGARRTPPAYRRKPGLEPDAHPSARPGRTVSQPPCGR